MTNQKTNWKYIVIVLILAIIVGGGILGYMKNFKREMISLTKFLEIKKPEKVVKDETANWKTYRNEEYGFEFKYPKEWGEPEIIIKDVNGECETTNFPDVCPSPEKCPELLVEGIIPPTRGDLIITINTRFCTYYHLEGMTMHVADFHSFYFTVRNKKYFILHFTLPISYCSVLYDDCMVSTNNTSFCRKDYEQCEDANARKQKIPDQVISTFRFIE